jgi:hypothetical protein
VIYQVTARFRVETADELCRQLDGGAIAAQEPDGEEIVASLNRASVVSDTGVVQWSEMCFCDPPLAHERTTILDRYFESFTTKPIENYQHYDGESFLEYLRRLSTNHE